MFLVDTVTGKQVEIVEFDLHRAVLELALKVSHSEVKKPKINKYGVDADGSTLLHVGWTTHVDREFKIRSPRK